MVRHVPRPEMPTQTPATQRELSRGIGLGLRNIQNAHVREELKLPGRSNGGPTERLIGRGVNYGPVDRSNEPNNGVCQDIQGNGTAAPSYDVKPAPLRKGHYWLAVLSGAAPAGTGSLSKVRAISTILRTLSLRSTMMIALRSDSALI
jgi:hypothetical protein